MGSQELAAEAAARSEAVLKLSREYTAILHEMNGQIESTGTAPLSPSSAPSAHTHLPLSPLQRKLARGFSAATRRRSTESTSVSLGRGFALG